MNTVKRKAAVKATNGDKCARISYDLLDVGAAGANDGTNRSTWHSDLTHFR